MIMKTNDQSRPAFNEDNLRFVNTEIYTQCVYLTNKSAIENTALYFNKKFELMLTRRVKAYSSSGSVV